MLEQAYPILHSSINAVAIDQHLQVHACHQSLHWQRVRPLPLFIRNWRHDRIETDDARARSQSRKQRS